MDSPSEPDVVDTAKADAAEFERGLLPHLPMLFAYSRAICGDYHVAQDVVQQTALIAFRKQVVAILHAIQPDVPQVFQWPLNIET